MPHIVIALIHSQVRLSDGNNDFQVVSVFYAQTRTFNREASLSQLRQGILPVTFTINLIGREPVTKRFKVEGNQAIRVEWKKWRYGWATSATIKGWDHLAYRILVTGVIHDLKDRTMKVLALTFKVGIDDVYYWRDFDQNARCDVFGDWKQALIPSTKAQL